MMREEGILIRRATAWALLMACALTTHPAVAVAADEATAESFAAAKSGKGLVLMDVFWARVWRCGRYENAQIRSLVFERGPLGESTTPVAASALLTLENPSRLAPPKNFVPYAFLVEPGDYHLTEFEVGFAQSMSKVEATKPARSDVVSGGRSKLGSFKVAAGETVYIGNWSVDCFRAPIPWRYYTEGKADFADHLEQYKAKYPFIDAAAVVYRLFETTELGQGYELK